MTVMLHDNQERQVIQLLRLAVEEVQLQDNLEEALKAWDHLQEMASLLQQPSRYLRQESPWEHWDQRLCQQVQLLGVTLFEAALQGRTHQATPRPAIKAPAARPAPITPIHKPTPSPLPEQPNQARPSPPQTQPEPQPREEPQTQPETPQAIRRETVKVTDSLLSQLKRSMEQRDLGKDTTHNTQVIGQSTQEVAQEMLQRGRNMASLADGCQDERLMSVLEHATSPSTVRLTQAVPTTARLDFFHMAVAYARGLQERRPDKRFKTMFGKLCQEMASVGFVYGMKLTDRPKCATWERDAAHHWHNLQRQLGDASSPAEQAMDAGTAQRLVEELLQRDPNPEQLRKGLRDLLHRGLKPDTRICRLLAEHQEALSGKPFKALRKAVQQQLTQDEAEEETNQRIHSATPPQKWPFWSLTRGKKAIMVGSQGKKYQLEAVQRAFGFSQLDWVGVSEGTRRVQAMNSSTYKEDCVYLVMHRYISHSASDHIWAKRDEAVVIGVDHGFSVGAVRLGIERDGQRWLDTGPPTLD